MKQRKLLRLKGFNYSSNALYFITICTYSRSYDFGVIHNGEMIPSFQGALAEKQWDKLITTFPYVKLHAKIIMPNHIHVIIEIDQNTVAPDIHIKSISNLISLYKSFTTRVIHQAGFYNFQWQRSFHDHIIRNNRTYEYILKYIENNPQQWHLDKLYQG